MTVEVLFLFKLRSSSCWPGVRLSNLEETPVNSLENFFKKGSMGEDESQLGPEMEASLQGRDEEPCSSELEERQPHGKEQDTCSSSLTEHVVSMREKGTTSTYDHSEAALVLGAEERVNCPICGTAIVDDNAVLNQHIDLCLNRGTVTQVVRCGTPPLDRAPETPTLTQPSASLSKGRKRQQRNTPEKAKRSKTHSPTSSMKLDSYFK